MKVLVVDDEPQVRGACQKTLEKMALSVQAAENKEEAWTLLRSGGFDIVLTDIHMAQPNDGVALAEDIKSRWPETDVVIMTGLPSLETAIPSLKSGACDYLIKPFEPALLENVVRRCLDRRRLSKELGRERNLRQDLQAAYAELQKVERAKDAFLSRVNHELRTPITLARMSAELIKAELKSGQGKALQEKLDAALKHMQETVESVLLYAALRSDLALHRQNTDLWGLLEKTVESQRLLWEERGLKIKTSCEGERYPLQADLPLMETVLGQLLINAIRFNKKGGTIQIRGQYLPQEARISFADTGVGIHPSALPKLFDGFYQVADHMTREVGGLGIGLALVRRIMEVHAGTVSVRSDPGQGSVFTISLPKQASSLKS